VGYYGVYEIRLVKDLRISGHDPIINVAAGLQHELSGLVGRMGAGGWVVALGVLVIAGLVVSRRFRAAPVGDVAVPFSPPAPPPASPRTAER
jgi:hypothetical protein